MRQAGDGEFEGIISFNLFYRKPKYFFQKIILEILTWNKAT